MKELADALESNKRIREVDNVRVPYLAGMNRQGTKLFFSKDFPHQLKLGNGQVIDPKPFVALHEEIESRLLAQGHHYQVAHQFATIQEHKAVADSGIHPALYEQALAPYVTKAHRDATGNVPRDLNREPYDEEHEDSLLGGHH